MKIIDREGRRAIRIILRTAWPLVGEPKLLTAEASSFTVQLHHSYEVVARSVASNLSRSKQFDLSEDQYLNEEKKIVWKAWSPFTQPG